MRGAKGSAMTGKAKNILFIMFDQLRWDYLSCAGHPHLKTPHLDRLAGKGVRFTRAYVQSPVCGAARMSYYTGRYAHSHGAQWNGYPLKVGEMTMGDHLRKLGMDCWLIGKTHMAVDNEGMNRLGIARDGIIGARVSECGFDVHIRDDGLWPEGPDGAFDEKRSPYNEFLKSKGYASDNPWNDHANSSIDETGEFASGWLTQHADKPANIKEEDSETPWLTSEAIRFMESQSGDTPWLAHLSYIKPHWPYIVPAPYHDMYGHNQILPPVRSPVEQENPHPVLHQFQNTSIGKSFHRDEVRNKVIPAYMGLIKQCDDQMGRLFAYLEDSGRMDDTLIVVTSDHGDYLGDHWMGEKDFFHECSVKVPLIIYDPSAEADGTRGTTCDALVEGIDLAATFIEAAGGDVPKHIVEGRSLMPFLHGGKPEEWRDFAVSEYDFSVMPMAEKLGLAPRDCRLFMVADKRWKFVHSEGPGHRPILFDMENDPNEFVDLGDDPAHQYIIEMMYERLGKWARRMSQRTTRSDEDLVNMRGRSRRRGVVFGLHDGSEAEQDLTDFMQNRRVQNYLDNSKKAGE